MVVGIVGPVGVVEEGGEVEDVGGAAGFVDGDGAIWVGAWGNDGGWRRGFSSAAGRGRVGLDLWGISSVFDGVVV